MAHWSVLLRNLFDYLACNRVNLASIRLDDKVSDLPIQRITILQQCLEYRAGIAIFKQRSLPALVGACKLLLDRRVQVDNETATTKPASALRVDDRTAARRQHDAVNSGQVINRRRLTLAKPGLTLFLENKRYVDTGTRLYFVVAVHKRQVQCTCELSTNRRLASAHWTNQKYIFRMFHR